MTDDDAGGSGDLDDLAQLTPDLTSLGWTDELGRWAEGIEAEIGDDAVRGRIARVSRGFSVVFTGGDAVLAASGSDRGDLFDGPATGDFVVVGRDPEDGPVVAAIADRRSVLQRRASGRVPEAQVLATNIDAVFVMHGLDRPMNPRRLERQLVVAWDSGAEPVVVLTKADTIDDPDGAEAEAEAVAPGVDVLAVSTVSGRNLDAIRRRLEDHRAVALLGLSGIGKSTLVNALSDGRVQRTGEVRAADKRGRHTTVTRDLIPLPGGGLVIDAPGVREIGLWQAYEGLDRAFSEISEAALRCRFADCEHQAEPGCGVRAGLTAAADGGAEPIAERRLEHWRELQAELALQETQLEEFNRRAESRDRAGAEDERDGARSTRRSRGRRSGSARRRKKR